MRDPARGMAAIIRLLRPTELVLKKRYVLLIVLLFLAAVVFWAYTKKNEPPRVSFAKVKRETLVSTLITNGKVEPLTYAAVRVDTAGLVVNLPAKEGQRVAKGTLLAELNAPGLQAQLTAALARVEQAKADLDNFERGGRKTDLVEIEILQFEPGFPWRALAVNTIAVPVDLGAVVDNLIAQEIEAMLADALGPADDLLGGLGKQLS